MKTSGAKVRGEPTTVGIADLNLTCYYVIRMTALEWQTDCFIQTVSCEVWYGIVSFQIRRSMGGSIATS